MKSHYQMIGLMSGTSVDGLDVAFCRFGARNKFELVAAKTYPYPNELRQRLQTAMTLSAVELAALDAELGLYFGKTVNDFLKKFKLKKPDAIASHGHTVFHDPLKNYSVQIGKGSHIAAVTNVPVVCDFRSTDVALGGQGAPLVPIGDEMLFSQYDYCLNLGGIANVSFKSKGKRIAYDISPCNLPVNMLMKKFGKEFDKDGQLGRSGKIIPGLLDALNQLKFYSQRPPRSLGREWVEREVMPLLNQNDSTTDVLRTYYEHIAIQIANQFKTKNSSVLVTGGGAYNTFLMQLIHQKSKVTIVTPEPSLIEFKEALIFAFLGYLRLNEKNNALKSVTGAKRDSVGGAIYSGK